jgi:hypothetical protein
MENTLFIGALAGIARYIHEIWNFILLSAIVFMGINVFFILHVLVDIN